MAIVKRRNQDKTEKHKESNIVSLKKQLQSCRNRITELKAQKKDCFSLEEKSVLTEALKRQYQKKDYLFKKLSDLGYQDHRGRPKKRTDEKYEHGRSKFTAMLLDENLDYLKSLKDAKHIDNISAFLDVLIENHRKSITG